MRRSKINKAADILNLGILRELKNHELVSGLSGGLNA